MRVSSLLLSGVLFFGGCAAAGVDDGEPIVVSGRSRVMVVQTLRYTYCVDGACATAVVLRFSENGLVEDVVLETPEHRFGPIAVEAHVPEPCEVDQLDYFEVADGRVSNYGDGRPRRGYRVALNLLTEAGCEYHTLIVDLERGREPEFDLQ